MDFFLWLIKAMARKLHFIVYDGNIVEKSRKLSCSRKESAGRRGKRFDKWRKQVDHSMHVFSCFVISKLSNIFFFLSIILWKFLIAWHFSFNAWHCDFLCKCVTLGSPGIGTYSFVFPCLSQHLFQANPISWCNVEVRTRFGTDLYSTEICKRRILIS